MDLDKDRALTLFVVVSIIIVICCISYLASDLYRAQDIHTEEQDVQVTQRHSVEYQGHSAIYDATKTYIGEKYYFHITIQNEYPDCECRIYVDNKFYDSYIMHDSTTYHYDFSCSLTHKKVTSHPSVSLVFLVKI